MLFDYSFFFVSVLEQSLFIVIGLKFAFQFACDANRSAQNSKLHETNDCNESSASLPNALQLRTESLVPVENIGKSD